MRQRIIFLWTICALVAGLGPRAVPAQVQTGEHALHTWTQSEPALRLRLLEYAPAGGEEESVLSPDFFKSALVPGWGQFSQGKHFRAAMFVGVELAAIAGHLLHKQKYQDWKIKYEDHARQYWHLEKWLQYYDPQTDPSTHEMPIRCTGEDTEWHYPRDAGAIPCSQSDWEVFWNHEAYENSYKYDQFQAGWYDPDNPDRGYDPANPDSAIGGRLSPLRRENKEMRDNANRMAEYARTFAFTLMANHAIAAFEALVFPPDRADRASLDLRYAPEQIGDHYAGTLRAEYRW